MANALLMQTSSKPMPGLQSWPQLCRLQSVIERRFAFSRSLVGRALDTFGAQWADEFETLLSSLFEDEAALETAMKGYSAFAMDSMRHQRAFEKTREYPNKTYAEAAQAVYFNEAHMLREYLPGLLLSHFLWPHHYRQLQFFDMAFAAPLARAADKRFAEVGVGTGVYARRLLSCMPQAHGLGYDISPSSCQFATQHLAAAGVSGRFAMRLQDIVAQPMEPVPWLVCVEVLEHLEDPVAFLRVLRQAVAPSGKAFITAALNAAHADHIYLYRNAQEVWQHLDAAGFHVEQSFVAAAYAPSAPGVPVPLAAAFVVS